MAFIHFMEFTAVDGTSILQRSDDISTIIETVHAPKGGVARTVIHLLLRNNNRIQVSGETRESIIRGLIAQGNAVVVEKPPALPEVADDE